MSMRARTRHSPSAVKPWLDPNPGLVGWVRLLMLVGFTVQLLLGGIFGQTMARKVGSDWIEICSADGMRLIPINGDLPNPIDPPPDSPAAKTGGHCGDCILGKTFTGILTVAALPDMAPAVITAGFIPADSHTPPAVTIAPPRGPPASA